MASRSRDTVLEKLRQAAATCTACDLYNRATQTVFGEGNAKAAMTTRSPIRTIPLLMLSRRAIMRSKVDLPQPAGPTRTTNSPSSALALTPCRNLQGP